LTATLCIEPDTGDARTGEVSVLYDRLRRLDSATADAALTSCLVWLADALMRIAQEMADPRCTGALVEEASAVLARLPEPADRQRPESSGGGRVRLTDRQLAVLRRLPEELSLRQIADGMYVSHNTVKSHTRAVYRKLGAGSRTEAVDRARELGQV
jgi:DNA-binding NarL/FixJ family response regulator